MRIDERLTDGGPSFSFEFFPPKTEDGERNLATALDELSGMDPTFVSVTYGAGGSLEQRAKTIDIVAGIKEDFGLEAMAHFTCVNATTAELRATLDRMRDAGIANVLALRGDPPQGETEWTATEGGLRYSRELIELIRDEYPEFAIGAACFPETHIHAESSESDLQYLKEKVDAGARFLITQLFFDNASYYDFVARAREAGVDVPIVPGIMPITNYSQIRRITEMCGSVIPAHLVAELDVRADRPRAWIARQAMFFVGTAPLAGDGCVNVSPKGPIGSLRVLDDHTVAYLDVVGSGAETIAHIRENGRVVVMLCAFQGPPRILRLHGRGELVHATDERFPALLDQGGFEQAEVPESHRAIIVVHVTRIADSCGYGVPLMDYAGERPHQAKSSAKRVRVHGPDAYLDYQREKNAASIDGLP